MAVLRICICLSVLVDSLNVFHARSIAFLYSFHACACSCVLVFVCLRFMLWFLFCRLLLTVVVFHIFVCGGSILCFVLLFGDMLYILLFQLLIVFGVGFACSILVLFLMVLPLWYSQPLYSLF